MDTASSRASAFRLADPELSAAALIAVRDALGARSGEKALIVTNPAPEVFDISTAVYDAFLSAGACPTLVVQPPKAQTDFTDEAVIAAFDSNPDIFVSLSSEKLGKDRSGLETPYEWDGTKYDHIFDYQLRGAKTLRAFWSPNVTKAMFAKTLAIDYTELRHRAKRIKAVLDDAVELRVSNAGGTDIRVGLAGRLAMADDGDYREPGSGGNLPAGETFVSPALGTCSGLIVFDGSIAGIRGDILIREPIRCRVEGGFVVSVEGGAEAEALEAALAEGEARARRLGAEGTLSAEKAAAYMRNARNIGELGIGLNPRAEIVGNMLEDEKAFRTCHFAIGYNYDEDAPALIHLDGLVSKPTISALLPGGKAILIEREGELLI